MTTDSTERENAITSYVTDMLSLESHIAKALKGQISDLDDQAPALASESKGVSAGDASTSALRPTLKVSGVGLRSVEVV